jgi:hypothetical protein
MKKRTVLYLFIAILLIALYIVVPTERPALAEPETPTAPEAVDAMPPPVIEFPGISRIETITDTAIVTETIIPDTSGAAGYMYYMQAVNQSVALYEKDGDLVDRVHFDTFWENAGTSTPCDGDVITHTHHGQPYVLFDHLAGRWVVSDVAYEDVDEGPYYICIAVSQPVTQPLFIEDNWYFYSLTTDQGPYHYYPDMPKLGLWPDGYYVSVDLFDVWNNGLNRTPRGVKVWAVNRSDLINGFESSYRFKDFYLSEHMDYEHLLPTTLLGFNTPQSGTPNYFASIQPGKFHFWEFHVDWNDLDASTFGDAPLNDLYPNYTINTDTGSTLPIGYLVPQGYTSEQVDAHGERLMSPLHYRILDNGTTSLWTTHAIKSSDVIGMRWYQIQFDGTGEPFFYQTGTYQPDKNYRWMGSLATDLMGNMALGFSLSSASKHPAIRYAGRLIGDPINELSQGEAVLYQGAGSQTDGDAYKDGPWGRQSQMTVDPLDECVFWYTNMYYDENGLDWKTRIGWFGFPECKGGTTSRISLHTDNTQGDKASGLDFEMYSVAISEDGRYVAFSSEATTLVDNDDNKKRDVFLRDRDTDEDGLYDEPGAVETTRISMAHDGSQANDDSWEVSISYDGQLIAFSSDASNLVDDDNNGVRDVFVYDRSTGLTERVSVVDITGDDGDAMSDHPFISGDGLHVAFRSFAPNLVDDDDNIAADIFVHERLTDRTFRVSIPDPTTGLSETLLYEDSSNPTLTEDGQFVAFASEATSLVLGDGNGFTDVFVHDRVSGQTIRASLSNYEPEGNGDSYTPFISGDGSVVVFASRADNLVIPPADFNGVADIYLRDLVDNVTSRITFNFFGQEAHLGDSYTPSVTKNGRYVAFASEANNLDVIIPDVNARRDIFVHDRYLAMEGVYDFGLTSRVSLDYNKGEPNDWSFAPMIAPGGRHVAFVSEATDLVNNDTNNVWDVFAYDSQRSIPTFLTIPPNIPASKEMTVTVPIIFSGNDYSIDTTTFSIDFDHDCLAFDGSDGPDDNTYPDAITFNLSDDYQFSASYNNGDKDGEIDFSIYDQVEPRQPIPDGIIATMDFTVKPTCQGSPGASRSARVGFSHDPYPSFGSYGLSIQGQSIDGFVRILPGLLGDCNGDGKVDAGDLSALVLEIFDGDDVLPGNTPGGTFPGNPVGCNPNQDFVVDAGDLSCTVMIIWEGSTTGCTGGLGTAAGCLNGVDFIWLNIPHKVLPPPGGEVELPVNFDPAGNSVHSVVFSIDYDESYLVFDPTDADGDGIPDTVTTNLPEGFEAFVGYDPSDPDGELDLVIYNPDTVLASLPEEDLLTIKFQAGAPTVTYLAEVKSSYDPLASFGSTKGKSLPGGLNDGSIQVLDHYRAYLPLNPVVPGSK